VRFAKAHGLGNDFILVAEKDAPSDLAGWSTRICDRHRGIGGDGVLLYRVTADGATMRLLNADGLPGEVSGNGLRCLAALGVSRGWAAPRHVVSTGAGPRAVEVRRVSERRFSIETDLGVPALASTQIPMALDPPLERVVDHPLVAAERSVRVTATSLGNPHCAVFLDEPPADALIATLGPALERHPAFPRRTNVEFVSVRSREEIRVRFWERGVGPTQASGTGSASAVVAASLRGVVAGRVRAVCDGGVLEVEWDGDGPVRQVGEAEIVFEGEWFEP
jgi:diaminopimelate epimerase